MASPYGSADVKSVSSETSRLGKPQNQEHYDKATAKHSTFKDTISIRLDEAVGSASISPSGRDVCLASTNGLHIVDLDDPWARPRFIPHFSAIVADVQWSPHPARAHWVISTSGTKALVFNLNIVQGNPIEHTCVGHDRSITDINWAVFQPDSFATCGIDGNVLCYDLRIGGRKATNRYCGWRLGATQVKFNRQNPNQIASSHGQWLYVWDDRKGSSPVTTVKAHEHKIYGIDWNRSHGDQIVTCSLDRSVKVSANLYRLSLNHFVELYTVLAFRRILRYSPAQPNHSHILAGLAGATHPIWRRCCHPSSKIGVCHQNLVAKPAGQGGIHNYRATVTLCGNFYGEARVETTRTTTTGIFQLVTWGSDRQLLLTPISHEVTALVGHQPHQPMQVRHTRRYAQDRSFRNTSAKFDISASSEQSRDGNSTTPDSDTVSKMTPPFSAHTRSSRLPGTNDIHYGVSARSNATGTTSTSTSGSSVRDNAETKQRKYPADSKSDKPHLNQPDAYMVRASTRRVGVQDAVEWMENVRIVSTRSDGDEFRTDAHASTSIRKHPRTSTDEHELIPLHEELIVIGRAFQNRINIDKVSFT